MLKRNLAPIDEKMWEEIDDRAKEVLESYLSARKVVNVNGPKGLDYTVVPEGRLEESDDNKSDVCYGVYKVKPLTEARIEFEIDRWELDNIIRGAEDVELAPLEEAAKKIALFEENAIYNGLEESMIEGLCDSSEQETIDLGNDSDSIMQAITEGMLRLQSVFTKKPYVLVVGKEAFKRINTHSMGYPLSKAIKELLGTEIVYSEAVEGAFLLPYDHEDLEMTIGKDLSIGYQSSDNNKVRFFITESFTFRVLDPDIIVKFEV